jgi:MraZ protein
MRSQRLFFSNIEKLALDKAGRVLLPAVYRNRAGIDKEAVVLGILDKMELWAPEKYEKHMLEAAQQWADSLAGESSQKDKASAARLPAW